LLKEDDPEANRKGLLRSAYEFWARVWSAFFAVVVVSIGFPFVGAGAELLGKVRLSKVVSKRTTRPLCSEGVAND